MNEVFRPVVLQGGSEPENYIDAFSRQLRELFIIDNHQYIGEDKTKVFATSEFTDYCNKKKDDFVYVYYPWNGQTVKCIKAGDYFRLKTNRNQDLITAEEQEKLHKVKLAVFGMSVGSNIAFVATQAGIGQEIVLADFDELDTTNLNRILAGVHQIGLNKCVIAARRIYEDNPFVNITILSEGVNEDNLKKLLADNAITHIVEEIDDIKMKMVVRNLAREYKIPVVMITDNGDGVVLTAERYDLGYNKIFDKDDNYWAEKLSQPMNKELAGSIIINDIVGGMEKVDKKMIASVQRVLAKELVSWSQLGSAAILGGVIATFALKRIILGHSKALTVREYINLTEI